MYNEPVNSYDYYDNYSDNKPQYDAGAFSAALDAIAHAAQGVSLGWADEGYGLIGGTGRALANLGMRAFGYPVNNESFIDAWHKGYTDTRDYARRELQRGFERHPYISTGAEVLGAAFSPIRVYKTRGHVGSLGNFIAHPRDIEKARTINAIGTGIVNGIGNSDNILSLDCLGNSLMSAVLNYGGMKVGNQLFGSKNMMNPTGRAFMSAGTQYPAWLGYNSWINDNDGTQNDY